MSLQTQSVNLMMVLEEKLGNVSHIEFTDDVFTTSGLSTSRRKKSYSSDYI